MVANSLLDGQDTEYVDRLPQAAPAWQQNCLAITSHQLQGVSTKQQ
jgi:hypothetical protein